MIDRDAVYPGHRSNVAQEIETELLIERGIDGVLCVDEEQHVTVRGRAHDRLGCDVAAGTWPRLHHELLSKSFREPLGDQPCRDVGQLPPPGRR